MASRAYLSYEGGVACAAAAICFLEAGVVGYFQSNSQWIPPNNYFVGLGVLFLGMAIVLIKVAHIETREIRERAFTPIGATGPAT